MRDARFDELDALIAEEERYAKLNGPPSQQGRRPNAGRPPGRSATRYGFAALDRGDDERLRRKMMKAPHRENGFAQKIQHTYAWAKRRAG